MAPKGFQSAEDVILAHLGQVRLFRTIGASDLRSLASRSHIVRFRRGQILHNEGDPPSGLFVVLSGAVDELMGEPNGGEILVATRGPRALIGLSDVLSGTPLGTRAQMAEATQLAKLPERDLADLFARPDLQAALARELQHEALSIRERLRRIALFSLEKRVVCYLHEQASGHTGAMGKTFAIKDSQPRIATLVHASRTRVNITLQKLVSDGDIKVERNRITIRHSERFWSRYDLPPPN